MELLIVDSYEDLSRAGGDIVATTIASAPQAAIVVATGNTPMGMYRYLARHKRSELDTSMLRIFQLDEYLGVSPSDRRSLYGWMLRAFLIPLGIPEANVVRLPWDEADLQAGIKAYEQQAAAAGGFDLSLLGLGPNGHLGFNEPPSDAEAGTRAVDLTPESIQSNAQYWGGNLQVPRRAVTAGMNRLLTARRTILLVSGAHKRDILRKTIAETPTPMVPASLLQLAPNVTVIADTKAWPHNTRPGAVSVMRRA